MITPPIPFFGSKRQAAPQVWEHLGNPAIYIEPFAGSLAVLLARPDEPRAEVACDLDGLIINFWRAIQTDHEEVLGAVSGPVSEVQVDAWHRRLILFKPTLTALLRADPAYYDPDLAAMWWAGASSWLGSGWCIRDKASRQRPHIDRTLKGLYAVGCTDERVHELANRLSNVVLLAGDWTEAWRRSVTDAIINRFKDQTGGVGVFLDPPYSHETGRVKGLYDTDTSLSEEVQAWALTHARANVRIVVAGYLSEYPGLTKAGWEVRTWTTPNGYINVNKNERRKIDVMFLSPPNPKRIIRRR